MSESPQTFLLMRIAEDGAEIAAGRDFFARDSSGWMGHAAIWDRTRALAECEAKRRIIELHRPWDLGSCYGCGGVEGTSPPPLAVPDPPCPRTALCRPSGVPRVLAPVTR